MAESFNLIFAALLATTFGFELRQALRTNPAFLPGFGTAHWEDAMKSTQRWFWICCVTELIALGALIGYLLGSPNAANLSTTLVTATILMLAGLGAQTASLRLRQLKIEKLLNAADQAIPAVQKTEGERNSAEKANARAFGKRWEGINPDQLIGGTAGWI